MKIGEIIEASFNLPWRNRFLIFFGALIALFSGGYGLSSNLNYAISSEELITRVSWLNDERVIIAISILVILLALAGFVISLWAGAAIIQAVSLANKNKPIERKAVAKVGSKKLLRLVVLSFVLPLAIFIGLVVIAAPLVYLFSKMPQPTGLVSGAIVGVIILLLLIPTLIYLGLSWALAIRFIVLDEQRVIESLKSALSILKGRFWRTFGFAILFGLIGGAGSAAASLPLILLGGSAYYAFTVNNFSVASGIGILTFLYYVIYLAIVGYFQAFVQTGWTLWWFRLKDEKAEPTKSTKKVAVGKADSPKRTKK